MLAKKGLKRVDLVYVLEAEEEVARRYHQLRMIYFQWEKILVDMQQEYSLILTCQNDLASLDQPVVQRNGGPATAHRIRSLPRKKQLKQL